MEERVLELLSARKGHFLLESGHHGELWLDLETLCRRPPLVKSLAAQLARSIENISVDAVCGPLVEGAFVGMMVALELDLEFTYSERFARPSESGLFRAGYRIPSSLRPGLRGKRVAIVNDVINAGSAVRGTFEDLEACGAAVAVISTLLVLGTAASEYASSKGVALKSLAEMPNNLWTPGQCPLCASGVPLEDVAGFSSIFRPGTG
jgi:orotate phosphoribosyltransferase